MPTPEEIQAKMDAAIKGTSGRTTGSAPTSRQAPTPSAPVRAGGAGANAAPSRLPVRKPSTEEIQDVGTGVSSLFSGETFLREFFNKDISGWNPVARFAVDQVAAPATLMTAGFSPMIKAPLSLLGKIGAGKLAQTPLGRLAWNLSTETAVGVAGSAVGQQIAENTPEDAPTWRKVVAPVAGALATGVVSSTAVNRALRNSSNLKGTAAAASQANQNARGNGFNYLPRMQSFDDIIDDFATPAGTSLTRRFWGGLGIDPVRAESVEVAKPMHAWARQKAVAPRAAQLAVAKALPRGFDAFDIDDSGNIRNLLDAYGKRVPDSYNRNWNDVFSDPDAPSKYNFNNRQMDQWESLHKLLDDVVPMADLYGIKRAVFDPEDAGRLYVPRQARDAEPGVYEKPSNPAFERLWEDATDAANAGVKYTDPETVVRFHIESLYKQIADKQLDDAVEELTVLPSRAFNKDPRGAARVSAHRQAVNAFGKARLAESRAVSRLENLEARLSELRARGGSTTRKANLMTQITDAKADLNNKLRPALKLARKNKAMAKQARDREYARFKNSDRTRVDPSLFNGGHSSENPIPVRMWKGRMIAEENYDRLIDWFNPITGAPTFENTNRFMYATQAVGDQIRAMAATADFSAPFIQLLPLLVTEPEAWARASAQMFKSWWSPGVINRYMQKNAASIEDMVINGRVPSADLEQYAALQGSGILARGNQKVFGRWERSYSMALLAARHEMWASLRPTWTGTAEDLGKYVRNATGGMDTAAMGVGRGQRALESLAFFSPKLLRSTIALAGDAMRPWTPAGAQAANTILKLTAASAGLFAIANMAVGLENGETEEQIDKRLQDTLNPLSGKEFLSVKIGDNWYGVGGQVRALTQLVTGSVTGAINFARDGTITGAEDNPIVPLLDLLNNRTSPLYKGGLAAAELATDEELNLLPFDTIDSVPDLGLFIGKSALPFVIQEAIEMAGDPLREFTVNPLLASMSGGRTSPITPSERLDDLSREKYDGRSYGELWPEEKGELKEANPDLVEAIKQYGSKHDREYQAQVDQINEDTQNTLKAIAAAPWPDRAKLRDAVEARISDRSIQLDTARHSFGKDFAELDDTAQSLVLDAYYETFTGARLNPDDPASPLNFDVLDQLQAEFERSIDNHVYGDPDAVREGLEKRRAFKPPPELAWFFENKEIVRQAGYWDAKDRAFTEIADEIQRDYPEIQSAGQLLAKVVQLENAGMEDEAYTLSAAIKFMDKIASQEHRLMRMDNPRLDRALKENGYTTTRLTDDEFE